MAEVPTQEAQKAPTLRTRWKEVTGEVHRGFIAEWTVTIVLLLFATTTLVQAFVIPSASMENTMLIGDHVLVDKLAFSPPGKVTGKLLPYRDVRRGDIIVFRYPLNIKEDYVKRAIGIPGDRVKLVDKKLMLNGHFPEEPYVIHRSNYPNLYRDNFPKYANEEALPPRAAGMVRDHVRDGELIVPPGYVFAMGDNRDDSADSRYWGLVPRENIVGTPLIIYWSYEATTAALTNPNIGIDHIIDIVTNFFSKTRWRRTFKLIRGYPLQ
jgi:signal peptidase I